MKLEHFDYGFKVAVKPDEGRAFLMDAPDGLGAAYVRHHEELVKLEKSLERR